MMDTITPLRIIYREMWFASPIREPSHFKPKLCTYVIVHESGGPNCGNFADCCKCVKDLQQKDITSKGDIRYNFLIGGDGAIYEGRGWYKSSISIPEYDAISVSVAFIGSYTNQFLTTVEWAAFKDLINFGVAYKFISKDYQILGHQQFRIIPEVYPIYHAQCPGRHVYELLGALSHWNNRTVTIYRN
ncbi:peptidoglycan-recognition protein SC2-like [Chelonus insularis]|uniref:peptidoglycan-recognition protein SC2-like n=1 Tax=Chelonus insularis TaxID=460826 RepID=UPI00158E2FB7|nr:peptidoglycan-recognition protein SC2-like [Chelonus insularis]